MMYSNHQISFTLISNLTLWCFLFLIFSSPPTNITAQQSFAPIDCRTMSGPVLAFDISKGQNPGNVSDFLTDVQGMGVSVGTFNVELSSDFPACLDTLVIHGVANNLSLLRSYSVAEANRIKSWVESGHSLMLSGDYGTFKYPTQPVFQAFGYEQLGGIVEDVTDHDPAGPAITPYAWVIYQVDNFAPHPVLAGINSVELQASGWLDSTAEAVVTTDANANPATVSVMAAFSVGSGCSFFSTDSNWYAIDGSSGGYFKQDNAQFSQQVAEWLLKCGEVITNTPATHYLFLPQVLYNYCQAGGMDIILALDSSKSMLNPTDPGGPTRLSAAQDAAVTFLSFLNFSLDQAGVVSFDQTAVLDHPLSTDKSSLENTINGLDTDYETRIDLGISLAAQELTGSHHRIQNQKALVLLSDGRAYGTTETAVLAAASNAKAANITIYAIGLGQDANQTLLKGIASSATHYYFAPSTADLTAIYTEIATSLPCYGE